MTLSHDPNPTTLPFSHVSGVGRLLTVVLLDVERTRKDSFTQKIRLHPPGHLTLTSS